MDQEQILERITRARELLSEVISDTDSPMIERTLKLADMNLHWALWNLGAPTTLFPDLAD